MWGRHIEHELHEGTRGAKNEKQANQKAMMVMRRLLTPPAEESETPVAPAAPQKFRDPAAMMRKG